VRTLNTLLGCPISREDVFRYTNGRFLADEAAQIAKRYVRFDLDKLCDLVVSVSGSQKSPVCKIDKMEGGFSKALLMMMENGSEAVVKIPCSNAGRPMYSTASEVAVLNYGKYLLELGQNFMLIECQCYQLELIQLSPFLEYWPGTLICPILSAPST
jgi:hypothetical protein